MYFVIFNTSGFMGHTVWYTQTQNMEEKQLSFIQRPKLSKNYAILVQMLICMYMAKK